MTISTPESSQTEPASGRRQLFGAVVASTIGTTIEWYDFFLYGAAAALVFPKLFFSPDLDPFVAQILSFGTFTVGFLSRPLGGVIFGHLGDRKGRKAALVATLLLMGVSTLLVGLVPTYERIGAMAPLALVALRILQGIGVGGEWGRSRASGTRNRPPGQTWILCQLSPGRSATGTLALDGRSGGLCRRAFGRSIHVVGLANTVLVECRLDRGGTLDPTLDRRVPPLQ